MRKPRYYYESKFYHVMIQGDEKKYIFQNDESKKKMIYLLKVNAEKNNIDIVAYCIMDNHAHILVYCPIIKNLSKMMSQCNTSFGKYFSKLRDNVGHVFRDRFKTESIFSREHFINCIKYIHENPVKAHICNCAKDYNYSSYKEFKYLSKELKEKCELDTDDIDEILSNSHTITRFLDDEIFMEDVAKCFEIINNKYSTIEDRVTRTGKIYLEIKDKCKIYDTEIAKLLGINRNTLLNRLKKMKLK